jgi:predicted RecB family nuclease
MATRITREVLEAYLNCKTKAHLKLADQHGNVSEYESLLASNREEVRRQAVGKVLSKHPEGEVVSGINLTAAALRAGPPFLLDTMLVDELLSLKFDGLMRVDGPSRLGNYHYVPVLIHEGRKIGKGQRRLLELFGLLLSRLQGIIPSSGIIWHGKECRTTRVRINADLRKTERLLREVKEAVDSESPRLILNDHCQVCEFRHRCHDQAVREDSISLLRGMGEKEIKNYARKGIFTVAQLAHTFRPRRRGKRSPPKENHRYHALQALAVRDRRVYVFGTPQLPDAPVHVYLDIEGNPDEGYDYLVGMIVVEGDKERHLSFWANSRDHEGTIFDQFLEAVSPYQDFLVFAYGGYERGSLLRMRKHATEVATVDRVLKALVNPLSLIYSHVYFPTLSNGLKDIGAFLGCSWNGPEASGIQSLVWRMRWETTRADEWRQRLITYNLEDCLALRRVTEFLYTLGDRTFHEARRQWAGGGPAVARVEEIDRLGSVRMRGKQEFFHEDFEAINYCGRFDYQRQRVFVRTNKVLKKERRGLRTWRNRKLRVSKRVQITGRKCPSCGSSEIVQLPSGRYRGGYSTRHKRCYDLTFTSGGIQRKVIEFRSYLHRCNSCGSEFFPERYEKLAKHFHGLMSWAMYEHVAHRASQNTLVEMFREFFGLAVCVSETHSFKGIMARYYLPCYNRLLNKILAGEVLHIDETEVRLRTEKGYVWTFATSEEVVYMYRPTREGDFLHDLLKNFKGVLVTDFYSAYDSLGCPQQKCLIHLMRDMNQELLNNPYDGELQSITGPFGRLLREIVDTIDRHGLKRRHLGKHERNVAKFFMSLATQVYRSEAAETLRARLVKYQDKLFTFIRYDGVPWNNNNAENAIRRFAYYREETPGRLKEPGIKDYLILLSLCHTCHYKGVSFLKLLLSRQRDIDAFCLRPRRRLRSPGIEVYPKGVVRPDFQSRRKAPCGPNPEQGRTDYESPALPGMSD